MLQNSYLKNIKSQFFGGSRSTKTQLEKINKNHVNLVLKNHPNLHFIFLCSKGKNVKTLTVTSNRSYESQCTFLFWFIYKIHVQLVRSKINQYKKYTFKELKLYSDNQFSASQLLKRKNL